VGRAYDSVTPELRDWLADQKVFFVGTAPSDGGHVNVSPKGLDTFAVVDEHTVAYLDLTGSGIETIAHVRDNGRITLMFCAFEGPAQIVRIQGRGRFLLATDPAATPFVERFPEYPGARAVIVVEVDRVATSCGYGVPEMRFVGERDRLIRWAEAKGEAMPEYWSSKNAQSIDGLPGIA